MTTRRMMLITIQVLWIVISSCVSMSLEQESPEETFRRTVVSWQSTASKNDWSAWHTFSGELWYRFVDPKANDRLEIVGALEEAILVIERVVFQQGEGANAARDIALSKLYTTYAKALTQLNEQECLALALDPHTLLIGAETVDKQKPDTHICIENGENSLRNAASLDATNKEADQLIADITGKEDTVHKRKPKEFVAELFDSFADTFDDKLLKTLDYKVPALVGDLAKRLSKEYMAVLDAGCGTGLAGRYIRQLVPSGPIVGVDASQKMLDKAKRCTLTSGCGLEVTDDSVDSSLYDGLVKMDLEEMSIEALSQATGLKKIEGFDLIIAADVLVYFGDLHNIFQTFAEMSVSGGRLIFSCELATEDEAPLGWRLLSSGRFAHTKKHAVDSANAASYEFVSYEEIIPRIEKGEPVKGHLFAFQLKKGAGSSEL